ncbi:MAG: tetrahydrofolate dehydrogenase/cyclohydrolase catalytic domain-containing protein [candidate division Zixibacteria bacterium]|nr:tetrahydrofolate dehydrogenase/cyclohydrolase catalytic domain-containing protein [candidate division Zixibacteria bacterium]
MSETRGNIIDGKAVAKAVKDALKPRIAALLNCGITPGLTAILVGDDPGSETYVRNKVLACEKLGLASQVIKRPSTISQSELADIIAGLNADTKVHGILTQSPLPQHIDALSVTLATDPAKDVDGFHPYNLGMLLIGRPTLIPCTPYGIQVLLEHYQIPTAGKEVVVVGRSNIVGKPVAALLMQKGMWADATVTVAHSKSTNLDNITCHADILIAAIGSPNFITAPMIKPGATVIDVGINRLSDSSQAKGYRLVGDVDFDSAKAVASHITPVPGGVGPMTIAMLMQNTVTAAERQTGISR